MEKTLLVALVTLIHVTSGTLIIKGPSDPVLNTKPVTLECLYSESGFDISQVHFEYFNNSTQTWHQLWGRPWCGNMMPYSQSDGEKAYAYLRYPSRYSGVPFRCVSDADNVTAPDNASQLFTFKVHYLDQPLLSMDGYSSYLNVPEDLKVRLGEDVTVTCSARSSEEPIYLWQKEGSNLFLDSSTLSLKKMSLLDGGRYTCLAKHPTMEMLNEKRTITITVLEDAPWYETSYGHLCLMTSAAAVALFLFIVSVSVLLCRRAKRIRTSKGPIDDRSQKKPIYKASAESLPSISGDKQPLV